MVSYLCFHYLLVLSYATVFLTVQAYRWTPQGQIILHNAKGRVCSDPMIPTSYEVVIAGRWGARVWISGSAVVKLSFLVCRGPADVSDYVCEVRLPFCGCAGEGATSMPTILELDATRLGSSALSMRGLDLGRVRSMVSALFNAGRPTSDFFALSDGEASILDIVKRSTVANIENRLQNNMAALTQAFLLLGTGFLSSRLQTALLVQLNILDRQYDIYSFSPAAPNTKETLTEHLNMHPHDVYVAVARQYNDRVSSASASAQVVHETPRELNQTLARRAGRRLGEPRLYTQKRLRHRIGVLDDPEIMWSG